MSARCARGEIDDRHTSFRTFSLVCMLVGQNVCIIAMHCKLDFSESCAVLDLDAFKQSTRLNAQGFERVSPVEGELASVEARAPWDGKDGEGIEEEEFSLDDLMGDDDAKEEL